MVDIGIVIVNYNVRQFLVQCLQSIRRSRLNGLKVEIHVVDNASVDGTTALLRHEFPEVHLIENTENVGFSKANNQAIRLVDAKYVLLLNPDTILEEDTLMRCFDYMERNVDCGALGVRMIDGDGNFLPESKRKIPDVWNSFCKLVYLSKIFPKSRWFSGYNLGYLPENETADIEVLCGAFMFIRKETLDKTGLLDERFFMYGEDIDLSYRILKAGYRVVYFPETSIIHFKGESTKKASLSYVRTFYGAMSLYVNKHYSGRQSIFFRWFILIAIQMRALISGVGKFLKVGFFMAMDGIAIASLLHVIKVWWAAYYFENQDYYHGSAIMVNIIVYSLIWVTSLWFFGRYDEKHKLWRMVYAVITGLWVILMVYALETEAYRTSRALILLGSVGVLLYVLLSEWIFSLLTAADKTTKTTILVAHKDEAGKINNMLALTGKSAENVYFINPGHDEKDPFFSNHISLLDQAVSLLKADEVVFSSSSLPIKDIMNYMTKISRHVDFKIVGDESLGIIGKKIPGKNLYTLNMFFPLEDGFWKRVKTTFDILVCLVFIPLIPLIWILNVFKGAAVINIFLVLARQKTWVGYGGDKEDFAFLPELPRGVISFPLAARYIEYQEGYFKTKNLEYAKSYTPILDLSVLLSNLTNLYGK